MTALLFPSGERCELAGMPRQSSGRTTLADGSEGAQLQPELARALPPPPSGLRRLSSARLLVLTGDLGALVAVEGPLDEPWCQWAAQVSRQALAELARRVL